MKSIRIVRLVTILVLAGLVSAGCAQKEKQQIRLMEEDLQALQQQRDDLAAQLAAAQAREADLMGRLDASASERSALEARMSQQQAKPAAGEGWEKGISADRISLGSDILFSSGSVTLTAQGKAMLDRIAGDLNGTYANMPVRVIGHTDSQPIDKSRRHWKDNLDLSANRAMEVTRYLWSKGVQAARIETIGMGEHHSTSSNTSSAGRAQNRRVEIVVVKT